MLWKMAFFLVFIFVGGVWAEDYVPLYNLGQKVSWCSSQCLNEDCTPSLFCYYAPPDYRYYYKETWRGFRSLYNPTDARVVCRYAPENPQKCVVDGEWNQIYQLCGLNIPGCLAYGSAPEAFRVFLPPGTKGFKVIIHYARDKKAGVAVRFGSPPEAYQELPSQYEEIPWQPEGSVTLDQLFQEVFYRNNGGTIYFYANFEPLSEGRAGWLYFRLLPQFGQEVHEFQIQVKVDYPVYRAWYENVAPCPAEGRFCWDSMGNPVAYGVPVSCDAEHLFACTDEFSCAQAGGYWYDDACHNKPPCSPTNLSACTDSFSCALAGGHWCEDHCQAEECQSFVPPRWSVSCQDDQGVARFWVTVEDCGSLCGQSVRVQIAATDPEDVSSLDYSWLPGENWVPGSQPFEISLSRVWPVDLLAGYQLSTARVSGWYAGVFIDVNGDGTFDYDSELRYCQFPQCGPEALHLCQTEESCREAGGYWVEGRCEAAHCEIPSREFCASLTEEACLQNRCGWSPGNPGRCYSCEEAQNAEACQLLEGCVWDDHKCLPKGCGQ